MFLFLFGFIIMIIVVILRNLFSSSTDADINFMSWNLMTLVFGKMEIAFLELLLSNRVNEIEKRK